MLLENSLIRLEYNPAKDLLYVEWPDVNYYSLPEFVNLLDKVLDTVKFYDIGFLLLDAQHTYDAIRELEYMDVAIKFLDDLSKTRVKKVARLVSNHIAREKQIREISDRTHLTMDFQTFANKEVALRWLSS